MNCIIPFLLLFLRCRSSSSLSEAATSNLYWWGRRLWRQCIRWQQLRGGWLRWRHDAAEDPGRTAHQHREQDVCREDPESAAGVQPWPSGAPAHDTNVQARAGWGRRQPGRSAWEQRIPVWVQQDRHHHWRVLRPLYLRHARGRQGPSSLWKSWATSSKVQKIMFEDIDAGSQLWQYVKQYFILCMVLASSSNSSNSIKSLW